MKTPVKPSNRPENPEFSSGPTKKRPGWSPEVLSEAILGRSHRSKALAKPRIQEVFDLQRKLLGLPDSHLIGLMPGSDTGAFEAAMWSLLGARGVTALAWESFGKGWVTDIRKQLKLEAQVLEADYGSLPDLGEINWDNDVVFTWNGTTSGVCVPNGNWIPDDRKGLTLCDATSGVFAQEIPWDKIDALTYSWQKVPGGEGQHGMLILGPRAVERLETYSPNWPMPKIFRLTKEGQLISGIFNAETINTPSMLCVEDMLDSLKWMDSIGGLSEMIARANRNLGVISDWVAKTNWVEFLAKDPSIRSNTSVCLKLTAGNFELQAAIVKKMVSLLEEEGVAYDINAYRDAPSGLRIWCGGTVELRDVEALLPWLDWAFDVAINEIME